MNYLISSFDCSLFCKDFFHIIAGAKYKVEQIKEEALVLSKQSAPFLASFLDNTNVLKINFENNNYYFLFPVPTSQIFFTKIKHGSKEICISLSSNLILTIDGELLLESDVENIKYSHFETDGEICLIYFKGKRNYIVVIKGCDICYSDYYDECNISDEKYFMTKKFDLMNHGKVCHIKESTVETFLVYLDNEELFLKPKFLVSCFVDCLLAQNYKYCNQLLSARIRCTDEQDVGAFFPKFDKYYQCCEDTIFLFKKNTLAGIYKFEFENLTISNIRKIN